MPINRPPVAFSSIENGERIMKCIEEVMTRAMRYEHRSADPIHIGCFIKRMLWHAGAAIAVFVVPLIVGTIGFSCIDLEGGSSVAHAFHNSASYLAGFGAVYRPTSPAGRVFSGLFELFAGLFFLSVAGLMLAPILHRLMHWLHRESPEKKEG
jgi:hypothetical protein